MSSMSNPYKIPMQRRPDAYAYISGSPAHAALRGEVYFYQTPSGVLVAAQAENLPNDKTPCAANIFGFHIHEGGSCTGNAADPFADTGAHYNPGGCPHPAHAGDLPPLFGNQGSAFSLVLTDRFTVRDIIGRTVIIHDRPDDFTTQPSGNSGAKIACGKIVANRT